MSASINSIPQKISLFNIYNTGNKLIGISGEVTIPDFESVSEDLEIAGILGPINSPTPGLFNSMEMEIPFLQMWTDIIDLMNPLERRQLTLRGSVHIEDAGLRKIVNKGMRIIVEGYPKGMSPGAWKAGSPMNSSLKLELEYIKIDMDNKNVLELDKLNAVYKLNGTDIMEKIREQI